jgi:D-alanine-D-alanine ligase
MRVAVLMGGMSAEREISILSGEAVYKSLLESGYDARKVVVGEMPPLASAEGMDAFFIALHGGSGEDGTVQRHLEDLGLAYTGSGPEASMLAMNKVAAKKIFLKNGVPTPDFTELHDDTPFDEILSAAREKGWPVVVKPVAEGSTLGVSIVGGEDELADAVEVALAYGEGALMETYVDGRELTVGILGEETLPIVEVRPAGGFYDFNAKYKASETVYVTNPDMPKHSCEEVAAAAFSAHTALGCRDMSRVDVRLSKDGAPFVLEVNTIPGLTARSLLPKAAQAAGITYAELVDRITKMALQRRRNSNNV